MARTVRDTNLETRTARARLKARREPYWRAVDRGAHLGYYRGARGGSWIARLYKDGRYHPCDLGRADDSTDADGVHVLDYFQALDNARAWFPEKARELAGIIPDASPYTVKQACEDYVAFLKAERKSGADTERRLKLHVIPKFGERPVASLRADEINAWKRGMVRISDDPEAVRKSRDTANRVLTMFKAALNRAFGDETKKIPTDAAWNRHRVKPFKGVGRSRQVHLDVAQSKRLINACDGVWFRRLVTGALLTGARPPGELIGLHVRHFHRELSNLSIPDGKTGPREVTLTAEGVRWFESIAAGRGPDALLFPKDGDGTAWGTNHHLRPMREAVKRAKLPKATTIYACRHTYASQSILAGMNLKLLAENMGTSIRMLETNYAKFIAAARRKLVEESAFKLGLPTPKVRSIDSAKRNTSTRGNVAALRSAKR